MVQSWDMKLQPECHEHKFCVFPSVLCLSVVNKLSSTRFEVQSIPSLYTPYLVLGQIPFLKFCRHMQHVQLPWSIGAATDASNSVDSNDLWCGFRRYAN
jgi:hypothetical protein